LSDQNNSRLHKLADAIAGPPPRPGPVDHVRAAVESFVQQKDLIERQAAKIRDLEIANARLDVELETHVHLLNEAMRDRDHYMAYSYTLTTQLDCVQKLICDALDMAKRNQVRPPQIFQSPPLQFEPEPPIGPENPADQ
jgi:hypothetical protein